MVEEEVVERRRKVAVFVALTALAFCAFANSIPGDYVFDDVKIVKINPVIRSLKNIPRMLLGAFTKKRLLKEGMKVDTSYRPVRYISYALDHQFTGDNPAGYHISNIIYHSVVSFLLFLLLLRLGAGLFGATVASALFCIHPVNSEAVAYITSRKELLCALFFFASFLTYLSYRERPSLGRLLLMTVLFLLALFSKEMALSLFGVLLLYELMRAGRRGGLVETLKNFFGHLSEKRLFLPLGLVFGISFCYGLYSIYIKNPAGLGEEWVGYWGGSFLNSLLSVGRAFLHYIRLILVPHPLSADYSGSVFPPSSGLLTPPVTVLALLLHTALVSFALFLFIRKRFVVPFAVLLFYVTLVPVSQVFPTPERVAERFLYIPMFAFTLLVAFGLKTLKERRRGLVFAVFLLFPVYLVMVVERNYDWRSNEALFGAVLRHYPNCARAHFAVGAASAEKGDLDTALTHFRRVVELLPPRKQKGWFKGYVLNARRSIASVLLKKGKSKEAAEELESLIAERDVFGRVMGDVPEFLHLHYDLGEAYFRMREYESAEAEFKRVLELAPKVRELDPSEFVSKASYRIGRMRSRGGAYSDAAEWFRRAFEAAPTDALKLQMRFHEALALFDSGRFRNAYSLFGETLSLADELLKRREGEVETVLAARKQSELMMARVQKRLGDVDGALRTLAELKKKYPDWWLPFYEEAQVYFVVGRLGDAEEAARDALSSVSDEAAVAAFKELLAAILLKRESKTPKKPLSERLEELLTTAKELLKWKRRKEAKDLLEKLLAHRVSVPSGEERCFYYFAEAQLLLLEKGLAELNRVSVAEAKRLVSLSARLKSIDDGRKALLYRRVAEMFNRLGDEDGELQSWLGVVEKNPEYLGAQFRLALLLLKRERFKEAIRHFEESVRQGYKTAESHYYIGKAFYRSKDYERAKESWLRFIKSAGSEDAERVREVVELLSGKTSPEEREEK